MKAWAEGGKRIGEPRPCVWLMVDRAMADLSTDIEALQAAHDAVAEQASLTLRWRLGLLLLLTVSLTAAWNGIRTGEAAAARKRIQALDPRGDWDGSRRLASRCWRSGAWSTSPG